jgi:hypothetical protein
MKDYKWNRMGLVEYVLKDNWKVYLFNFTIIIAIIITSVLTSFDWKTIVNIVWAIFLFIFIIKFTTLSIKHYKFMNDKFPNT